MPGTRLVLGPAMTEKLYAAFAASSLSFASARCAAGRIAMRAA
ncbi:MAG: hypothetical protein WBW27_01915 [Pseudolabrys sp.]